MNGVVGLFVCLIAFVARGAAPSTQPSTVPSTDPKLLQRLVAIDAKAGNITSLAADFEQKKFTALLRKPLVTGGRIHVKGSAMRWDTERPDKSTLLITDKDVRIYYPAQSTLEIYTIDQQMAQLAASPLPRLAVLRERFSIAEIPTHDLDPAADPARFLALKLTPTQDELREHVQDVRVLLDISAAYIVQAEFTDADGDRTSIRFRNVQPGVDVGELEIKLPAGTKITRPLEGLHGAPPVRPK